MQFAKEEACSVQNLALYAKVSREVKRINSSFLRWGLNGTVF